MLRLSLIILCGFLAFPSFGQVSTPSYRTTNGIPDIAGHLVTNPTPNGGIVIFYGRNGEPNVAPLKIREYQPDESEGLTTQESSVKAPEMYFQHQFFPRERPVSVWVAPIPLRERKLIWDTPISPSFHHMPLQITPAMNNPIFDEKEIGTFQLREN